jgi:hypothetical protein
VQSEPDRRAQDRLDGVELQAADGRFDEGEIIRPTGSMMLATKATHRSLVTIGCFAMLSPYSLP